MKILVTGAFGFIGSVIAAELAADDQFVIKLGNKKAKLETIPISQTYFADITNDREVEELTRLGQLDAVIHSAGLAHQFGDTPKESFEAVNVQGTRNITELAAKLRARQFILISSTAVYGLRKNGEKINESAECRPETFYAESKLKAEQTCREICEKHGIDLTILRLAPVIGEGNSGNVERLITAIDKKRFVWIGRGENLKTLIYKKDIAKACLKILHCKKKQTEIFNVAGEPATMSDLVKSISSNLNRSVLPVSIPESLFRSLFYVNSITLESGKILKLQATVEKWLSDDVYDANKIRRAYDFKAETTLTEGIKRQVQDYLSKHR